MVQLYTYEDTNKGFQLDAVPRVSGTPWFLYSLDENRSRIFGVKSKQFEAFMVFLVSTDHYFGGTWWH